MLVGLPSRGVSFALVWVGALGPLFFPNLRCLVGMFVASMPLIRTLFLLLLPRSNSWGIVVSTVFAGFTASPLSVAVGLMASNVKGNTKKSVVSAILHLLYCHIHCWYTILAEARHTKVHQGLYYQCG